MKFPRLFGKAPEIKESATAQVMVVNPGQPAWSGRNYAAFADEGYSKNVVANRCISSIAGAVSSVDLLAYRGEDELAESPLLGLLKRPNPMQSGSQFIEALTAFLLISGNYFLEKVSATGTEPKELYVLRPDRMTVIPGASGMPMGYEYQNGGRKHRWDVDPMTGLSDVWHGKTFNPLNDWYGMSPIEAGAYSIDQHNEAMKWMQALLQNSARPSGALVHTPKDGSSLSDEQFSRLKAEMESNYQGSKNAGRPMLLEGGLDWKAMGLSPVDMGIIESKYSSARDICLAFGVPPMLIGIPGDNTYANYAEARLAFWEDTVIPLVTRIGKDLSHWIGEGVELRPDLDQIPAIVDKRKSLWTMLDQTTSLTINEKRKAMGYEPITGGDVLDAMSVPHQPADIKALALIAGYDVKAKRA